MKPFMTFACALAGLALAIVAFRSAKAATFAERKATNVAGFRSAARGQCCSPPVEICPAEVTSCAPAAAPATCLVPQVVMEKHKKTVVRYRRETRERPVTVYREVPEKKTVEEEYTVMVPQQRTRTVEVSVDHPVGQNLELRTTTMTPRTEVRQATRTVCRMVPVEEERTIYEVVSPCGGGRSGDRPAAEENGSRTAIRTVALERRGDAEPLALAAAGNPQWDRSEPPPPPSGNGAAGNAPCATCGTPTCGNCAPACPPQVVCRTVKVTCMRPVPRQETVDYPVTKFQPDVDTRQVSYNILESRKEFREEQYTVEVPQKRTRTREVTVTRTVPVQDKEKYQATIPYREEIEVSVPRLRWVPQAIPAPPPTFDCGGCGG
jgi:hypothetical protein